MKKPHSAQGCHPEMDPVDASNVIHARSDMNALTPFVLTLHDQMNVITLVSADNNRYGRLLFLVELEGPTTFRHNTCQMRWREDLPCSQQGQQLKSQAQFRHHLYQSPYHR